MITSGIRLYKCSNCAARWFVTFDGQECKPTPIDALIFISDHNLNLHRPAVISGHCKISKSGSVNVAFNVGALSGFETGDAYTGWRSSVRIYIEEVEAPQQ